MAGIPVHVNIRTGVFGGTDSMPLLLGLGYEQIRIEMRCAVMRECSVLSLPSLRMQRITAVIMSEDVAYHHCHQ